MVSIHKDFDKILGGKLLPRNITHIYGPPASGKTNLALMTMKNFAKEEGGGGKVIYIDSEGGFSVKRLEQISDNNEFKVVMKNVMLIEPTEYDEQKVAIKKLDEIVPKCNAKLVIVDSIAVLYRLEEEKDVKELGRQLAQLSRIARRYNIPVLITNQVYTDINTQKIVPVGGDILQYWAKIVIELEKVGEKRIAILRKHKFLPEGMKVEFTISQEEGICVLKDVEEENYDRERIYHESPS
jgi:DNA repair protein RadB